MNSKTLTHNRRPKARIIGHVYSSGGATLKGVKICCNEAEIKSLADGLFVLEDLDPGMCEITATLQGFKKTTKTVSIREGEDLAVSFYLSKEVGTSKIHGHLYSARSKEILGKGGTVILILPVANKYFHVDERSQYAFENLPAGKYKVRSSVAGYEDNCATLELEDSEVKTHDFYCKVKEVEGPPWG